MDRKTKIKNIVSILWESENRLSDGYGYYCSGNPQSTEEATKIVDKYLVNVANRILIAIKEG